MNHDFRNKREGGMRLTAIGPLFAIVSALVSSGVLNAAEIKIIGGGAMAGAVNQLGQTFEARTGHKLTARFGATGAMQQLIRGGQDFDVAVLERAVMSGLVKDGFISNSPLSEFARVGMAVAVRAGSVKPDIGSVQAFRQALVQAKAVAYAPDGATGAHLVTVFKQLGISEQMKVATRPHAEARLALESLARGEADLAFAVSNNILAVKGVDLVGLFPEEIQYWVVTILGIGTKGQQQGPARSLLLHLTSPEAAAILKANGLDAVR